MDLGSGGGGSSYSQGSAGGGAIHLTVSGTLTIDGQISADGSDGVGGGSGGSVYIIASTLAGSGVISADGGYGATNNGGGGGGRIALYYDSSTYTGTLSVLGGTGYEAGGAGTIYMKSASQANGELLVDNGGITGASTVVEGSFAFDSVRIEGNANLYIPTGSVLETTDLIVTQSGILTNDGNVVIDNLTFDTGVITNNGVLTLTTVDLLPGTNVLTNTGQLDVPSLTVANLTLRQAGVLNIADDALVIDDTGTMVLDISFEIGSMTINSGGVLTHSQGQSGFALTIIGDMTINAGGSIDVEGRGYGGSLGPGAGTYNYYGSSGAGYGGEGGEGYNGPRGHAPGGATYGSIVAPTDLGSGGGSGGSRIGGSGGGAILLNVAGTLLVDGVISANGGDGKDGLYSGSGGGGGSGGSVYLVVGTLSGTGSILANGGDGGRGSPTYYPSYHSAGGGGGIIYITAGEIDGSFKISADGGTSDGKAGGSGGRIALVYDAGSYNYRGNTSAYGGSGSGPDGWGQYGTVLINGLSLAEITGIYHWAGTITEDTSWNYPVLVVHGPLIIAENATLTVEAGTIVKLGGLGHIVIFVYGGGLLATTGTVDSPVVFTSHLDDSMGGDTNFDGDATIAMHDDWYGISLCNYGRVDLIHTEIRYANTAIFIGTFLKYGTINLSAVTLRENGVGIYVYAPYTQVTADNCLIVDNFYTGVFVRATSLNIFRNCTIVGNGFGGSGWMGAGIHLGAAILTLENSIVAFNQNGLHHGTNADYPTLLIRYSDFYNPAGQEIVWEWGGEPQLDNNGNVLADPLFVDRSAGNYNLDTASPVIDAGLGIHAPSTDIRGRVRFDDLGMPNLGSGYPSYVDMGAYERQVSTPAGDLSVIYVADPDPMFLSAGDSVTIEWTVANVGNVELTGTWQDVVYLSDDPYLGGDQLFATVDHTGLLVAGASYSQTVAATVTGVSGPKYILIYTNANSSVQEASDMNNVAAASHVLAVDVPLLEIGTPQSATAIPYQWDYYRFEAEPGHTVLFSLDTAAYVYLRRGLPPTFADYDVAAGQKLRLLDPLASTYYLGVLPRWRPGGSTVYTLSADLTTLDIREVTPNEVGNNGTATIKILGDDFSPEADVQLIAPDGVVIEGKEYYQDSATLFATFDLAAAGAAPGQYDVVVINPGPELVTAVGVVTVMPGGAAAFDINLTIPGTSRPGRNIDVCIEYRNTGNIDLQSPLLTLESIEGTAWLLPDEYPENTWIESPSVSFLALSKDGPASTLRPGQSRMFIITARTPFIGAGSSMPFELYAFGTPDQTGLSDVIDWVQIGNDLAPPDSLSESWDPLFDRFVTQIGSTWGDYLDMLRVNANGLAEAGQRVHNVTELLGFEFIQAAALGTLPYFESAQDAFIPAPSLPLSFERYFLPGPSYRHRMGSLGYGWTHSYDITLRHRTDDSIVINGASGFDRIFTPNGSGGYTGGTGDFATLTPITEGGVTEYLLTETTGLETYFRSDGRFSYIEDTNSNRISASYNGLGQLVALTHTSGDRFEFTYDANGRLETLTDHVNRITTFGYDATGEHLTSVTTPGGLVTTYNYITGEGTLRDHLITEITPPGDPSVHFDYDTLGRMQHQHIATGFEPVDFVYSDAGRTAITDALSNTSTTWIDSRGRTILAENPLGYRTKLVYDTMSNLIEVISPTGVSTAFAYDDLGNLTSTRDPMGFVTSFSYDGPFTQLSMLRDANGNITRYAYDDRGNLTSITYADTSVETYHYNGVGNLDFYTNRRAQTIAYTYNSRGQLLTKYNTYTPGIIDFHYTYDSVGNLIEATNDVGTITLDYFGPIHPNADQLQRITYPEGQWLSYTYNQAGQRTTMIDQLGHVLTYAYDVAGRLWTITDEADAQAVEYLYDPVGRLQAKTLGNGVYTTYGYDPTGQLLDLFNHNPDDSVLSRFEYTYDPFGRRTTMTTTYGVDDPRPAGTWNYMYDNVGQLVAWTDPTGHHVEYIYDPMGNRLQEIDDDIVTDYVVNNLNQYTSVGGVPYLYDLDGNLIDINNGETIYTYNADNRFIATSGSEGSFSYQYDALGQRYLVDNESEQVIHITDPFGFGNLVGEYDATTGQQIAQHDHGFGLFQTFQPQNWDETFSYTFDALGNTVDVIRGSGFDDVHNIVYPDGESVVFGVLDATYGVFGGELGLRTAGASGVDMRARIYLSEIGRFAQSDPIGLASGDVNNYRYVGNDMVNRVDPSGLGGFGKIQLRQTQFGIRIPIADLLNLETVHEEYFFDDDGLSVSYYPHGINWNRENRKIYELGKNKYQDDLIREAVRILEESGNWEPEDFNRYTHNCQHFADALRWEYRWLNGKEQWRKLWMGVTRLITSLTPEDKFGPTGYDVGGTQNNELERWVASGGAFDYRIEFWNKPEAEVPTQDAIIIDRLDPAVFDLSTLKFTRIGFLNWDVALPGGQFIDMRIDCRPEMNIAVELKAGLGMEIPGFANNTDIDENTLVFWFHAIDPATGEYPADPFAGFLPPFNPETEFEIGWVEFRVDHKEDLPSGTRIENQAFVEFDFAGDIADHPAPKDGPWVNTIDTETPNSSVFPLPARIEETDFIVEWAGEDEDGGSGIASYDIYVSIDGGNYVLWLDDTEKTSVVYAGQMDHTYAFYSVVTDNVGHREALPPIPDAITKISLNSPPVAEAGEPYDVAEGGSIQLDASDSTDPDLPDEFLIYEWDFDEDGEYDDAEGINPTFSAIGFNGPDSVMVGLKVTDSYGDSDTDTAEVNVSNVGPIIELNPVTEINEDGTAVLTGTITDLGLLDTFTLTLDWGDPLSPHNLQTYVLGASETGSQTFVLSHQYLDDKPSGTPSDPYTILVTVTDDVDVGQADVTVEVANIAPEITEISCSATLSERSIEGEAVSVLVSFIDIGILDTHTAQIDWGDGTTTSGTVTESGGNGTVTGTHVYATGGIFTVAITLQDDDTGIAAANTTAVIIGVGVVDNQLHIIGTDDADSVSVAVKGGKNPTVVVDADFLGPMAGDFNKNSKLKTREFDAAGITGVLMVLCGGDDLAIVSEQSILDAIIDGGSGDDKLHGGAGNDILLGGEGDDKITGDGGADILIGGLGSDRLVGGTGDDILVSDQTAYESDESQNKLPETKGLAGIQAEWLSGKDYFERLDNITGNNPRPDRLNNGYFLRLGLTVWDDGQSDKLTGGRGKDWFLFSGDDWAVDIGGDDDDELVY